MHDVVATLAEREQDVRADPDRHSHLTAARDWHRRPDRDDVRSCAAEERSPSVDQVARTRRRRENADMVAELTEATGDASHVLVHVVWLRPRKRRNEADPERHLRRV